MRLLVVLVIFAFSHAAAETPGFRDMDGGWHEAIVVTRDAEAMAGFFETVAGWETIAKGALSEETIAYLAGDASTATGRYVVVKATDFDQGWVRIIELKDVRQHVVRANAQSWDTGGVFSLMTRSANIERNKADAEDAGWTAYNEPYDFGFGELKLRNIVLRGPDGVNLAIYEWVQPKREDAPPPGSVSKAFNSMQMVADLETAMRFYVGDLGFDVYQQGAFVDPENRPTNFALPVNYATRIPRDYGILIPKGADDAAGRIELMHFRGFEGRDLSERASLSNLGVATLMFPVSNIAAKETALRGKGLDFVRSRQAISLPPFGEAEAFTIASPEGALLTFFELTD